MDRLYRRGRLFERTTDWYSQDRAGNVWYFGEDTAELDKNGHVTSTEGTWMTGVAGAEPGIYMPAHPRLGESGRQEFYKGHAEDHFRVIALSGTVAGGPPNVKNILLTEEWTPLEPGTLDHKMYVRGVGNVFEQTRERRQRTGRTRCRHQKQLGHGRGANSTIAWAVTGPNLPEHSFARASTRVSAPSALPTRSASGPRN